MIRGVIFDMDGLMFDTERIWDTFWTPVCARLGVPLPPPQFYAEGRGLAGENTLRHIAKYIPQVDPVLVRQMVWELAQETFANSAAPCKPGLIELLNYLQARELPCIVASSSPRAMVERNLQNTNVASYFVGVVSGEDVTRSKPDPSIFLVAAERIGVPIEECLILEDSHNGVRAGHAAGAVTVMVPDLMPVTDEMRGLYTLCCHDLLEVRDLLQAGTL